MERYFLAKPIFSWSGGQGGIIRRQNVKKFSKHFLSFHNSICISWSLAATKKGKKSWQPIFRRIWLASWSSGHLYPWYSSVWHYCLCWEQLGKNQSQVMRLGWGQKLESCCACSWTSKRILCLGHLLENHNLFMHRDLRNSQPKVL